jgi:hypothetical protein
MVQPQVLTEMGCTAYRRQFRDKSIARYAMR